MKNSKHRQLSYAPAEISTSFCGHADYIFIQLQDLIKKQILLLCYDSPKSISELSEELQTGYEYIQDGADGLCRNKLLKKEDGKYTTIVPMFHLSKNYEATYIKNKIVVEREIPKRIVELTYSLKNQLMALDFYGNTFDFKYLNWVFFVMICNMIQRKLRTFFSDKTDEIIIDDYSWRTNNFNASVMLDYKYADEHPEKNIPECKQRIDPWEASYNYIGDIGIYNVFNMEPFPDGYNKKTKQKDYSAGRNAYLNRENISIYLKLVKGEEIEMNDTTKKIISDFEKNGVIKYDGDRVIPMIPVIPKEIVEKGENIVYKALTPIIQELADTAGREIENLLIPCLGNIKTRKDHFYSFWISEFINPRGELFWYGMNVDGLEIPKDYKKSVAGMWITW